LRRNCLLKNVIEGKIEEKVERMGRQRRRCKQILDDRTGHILRRNCLLKNVIEGKIEEKVERMGGRRRSVKQILDERKRREAGTLKRKHYVFLSREFA
jgi:metal-sulfur cluster biosynthetic enzyme